jgi:hypothetical protein
VSAIGLRAFTACDSGLALGLGRALGPLRAHRAQRHPGCAPAAARHRAGARVGTRLSGSELEPRLARLAARGRLRIQPQVREDLADHRTVRTPEGWRFAVRRLRTLYSESRTLEGRTLPPEPDALDWLEGTPAS